MHRPPKYLAIFLANAGITTSQESEGSSRDLLSGSGYFNSIENFQASWLPATEHTLSDYEILIVNRELSLKKKDTAQRNFDDGVMIKL